MGRFVEEKQDENYFLTYYLNPDEELDTMVYGMITNNNIDGVMKCTYIQIDDDRFIRFNITNRMSLQDFFDREVTKKELLHICEGIAATVKELNAFMIDTEMILLDSTKMFISMTDKNCFLTVLPVDNYKETKSLQTFLRDMILDVQVDEQEDIAYYAKLLRILGSKFTLAEFAREVDTLQKEVKRPIRKAESNVHLKEPAASSMQELHNHQVVEQIETPRVEIPVKKVVDPITIPQVEVSSQEKKKGLFSHIFKKEKKTDKPKKEKKSKKKTVKQSQTTPASFRIPGMDTMPSEQHASIPLPGDNTNMTDSGHFITPSTQNNLQYQNADFGETIILEDDNETTLLGNYEEEASAYLVRKKTMERVNLDAPYIRIGKNSDNDFIITGNDAISRNHALIEVKNNQYFLIDNNSKNHTYLNDMKLHPQEKYKLQDGDVIRFANEVFELHR